MKHEEIPNHFVFLTNEGKKRLKKVIPKLIQDYYEYNGTFWCRKIDEDGPLLLLVALPQGDDSDLPKNAIELQVSYEYVLCIVGIRENKTPGFLTPKKGVGKKHGDNR